jgi:hypothetical protein
MARTSAIAQNCADATCAEYRSENAKPISLEATPPDESFVYKKYPMELACHSNPTRSPGRRIFATYHATPLKLAAF